MRADRSGVGLVPVSSSPLRGRRHNWGTALTVSDPDGGTVVQAVFGKLARPSYAVFDAVGGRWSIEEGLRSGPTGVDSASILDGAGRTVATLRTGELVLTGGETVQWKLSGLLRKRCRLGEGLWVARPGGLRMGKFRAELSEEMLARGDLGFLGGIFSVLTDRAFAGGGSGADFLGDISGL